MDLPDLEPAYLDRHLAEGLPRRVLVQDIGVAQGLQPGFGIPTEGRQEGIPRPGIGLTAPDIGQGLLRPARNGGRRAVPGPDGFLDDGLGVLCRRRSFQPMAKAGNEVIA